MPDHPLMQRGQTKGFSPGVVVADVLRQTGGAYETTTPLTEKFRDCIRAVAKLTSDDELLRIADLPEVPVSLENCRQLDPQTRVILICRLDVSPAETPRWRRIPPTGIPAWPRGELDGVLGMCRGARIEERVLFPDGRSLLRMGASRGPPGITPGCSSGLQFTAVHRYPGRTGEGGWSSARRGALRGERVHGAGPPGSRQPAQPAHDPCRSGRPVRPAHPRHA
jgi:hypothetical protein